MILNQLLRLCINQEAVLKVPLLFMKALNAQNKEMRNHEETDERRIPVNTKQIRSDAPLYAVKSVGHTFIEKAAFLKR